MIKRLQSSLFILAFLFLIQQAFGQQFPYIESFRGSTATGITFGGAPSAFLTAGGSGYANNTHTGTPIDPNGEGYLRLTNNTQNQKGFIYSNTNFPSTEGLSVEFEYYIYGGNGADGISFFLFDATANPFMIGGFGGSLGYAQITTTNPISPGVSKGYIAIGLDEFGNFSNPTEGRQGGIDGLRPGSVTLRGKGDGSALTPDNYKFLTSVQTADVINGVPGFSLVGNAAARQPSSSNAGYRKVFMDMVPNPAGGYNITVRITRGGTPMITSTVIDNYYYPEAAPATLRYGLASSTGNQTNYHEIRNVVIDIYDKDKFLAPTASNDELTICQNTQGVVDVFSNDVSNNQGGAIIPSSIDLDPLATGIQSTFTVAGKGTFSLNQQSLVVFTPLPSFVGLATANYTLKDSFGMASNVAAVSVTVSAPPSTTNAGPDRLINVNSTPATLTLQAVNPQANSGTWTVVSGPNTPVFTNPALFNTTVTNLVGGTYVFRWTVTSAGGCQLTDNVQITINNIPVAVNDNYTANPNQFVTLPILNNDTDADGVATIDKSSISIKSPPLHGTLVVDNVTGIVTYRPNDNFSGTDSFVYTIKDINGVESNTAVVTIAVAPKPAGSDDVAVTLTNLGITIPALDNDAGKAGAVPVKNSDPSNGTVTINPDGTFLYTPNQGFSGKDTFTYKLTKDGIESNPITVTVNVKPVGSPDNTVTPFNTPVSIPLKDNDLSKNGTAVVLKTNPINGTVSISPAGVLTYTPNAGYSGTETFTYALRTADGLESDPINVTIIVTPQIPVAPNVDTDASSGQPKVIPIPIPTCGTIVITSQPANGTVTVAPATQIVTYTPNGNYSGPDEFTYIISGCNGTNSNPGTVTIGVTIPARIGLAKKLISSTKNQDGSFNLVYTFTLINFGDVTIQNVSLTDDLGAAFPDATIAVKNISATTGLAVNSQYNGRTNRNLLLPTSAIAAKTRLTVELEITVALTSGGGTFNNTAFTDGVSISDGTTTADQSTDGYNPDPTLPGDFSPNTPTPVVLTNNDLFIPGGFSPNGDGINDYFVIENGQGKEILLEVYNRWANRIYKSTNYQNNWDGKTTEGIHIGSDVPVGTYYFVVIIDGKEKRVGYITINR